MKKIITYISAAIITFHSSGQDSKRTEQVTLNGIDIHYEIYGKGQPLLLLHGWTQSSSFWSEYIPSYAKYFEVYAIDLRGHGNTSALSSNFSIKKSSEDILALLDHLKLKNVKAIGLSYGGLTLLELASSNPKKLDTMILIGASHNFNGGENTQADSFSYDKLPKEFIDELKKIHHHGESQIKALFDPKLNYKIDIDQEKLKNIASNTLIVHGDRDEMLGVEHAMTLYNNLPNAELWIVPNTGHLALAGANLPDFLKKSIQFLRSDAPRKSELDKN